MRPSQRVRAGLAVSTSTLAAALAAALSAAACSERSPAAPPAAPAPAAVRAAVAPLDGAAGAEAAGWRPPGTAAASELVRYPREEVEVVLGPQLRHGSRANPWPWFDLNQVARARSFGARFPESGGVVELSGKVIVSRGMAPRVHGRGTRFTEELRAGSPLFVNYPAAGGFYVFSVDHVLDDRELTLSGGWSPADVHLARARTVTRHASESYAGAMYYDLGLTLYLAHYRTGDAGLLRLARRAADSWWTSAGVLEGEMRDWGQSYAPRNVALGGLILRALDGRPEMFAWIADHARHHYRIWLGERLERGTLWYGVRDGGFALLHAAWLARVHPNAAVRAEFRDMARDAARLYYARLQAPDGGWYWAGAFGDPDNPGAGRIFAQPFMVGLLLEGLIATHQLTRDDPAIRASILKACEWLHTRGYRPDFRGMWYFVLADGRGIGARDPAQVEEVRQLNATTLHAFGYAYRITGDTRYLRWGDEIFAATFGRGMGPGADRHTGLADAREKEYNQSYRSAGRYLAWRAGAP